MDPLVNQEKRETEVCLGLRVLQVPKEILVLVGPRVLLDLLVLLVFLALKDKRDPRDRLVQLVRREILD